MTSLEDFFGVSKSHSSDLTHFAFEQRAVFCEKSGLQQLSESTLDQMVLRSR